MPETRTMRLISQLSFDAIQDWPGFTGKDSGVVTAARLRSRRPSTIRTLKPEKDGLFCEKNLRTEQGLGMPLW